MKYEQSELSDSRMICFIVDDRFRISRHAVLLFGMLVMIFCSNEISEFSGIYKFYRMLCVFGALILMSYLNMYILVPVFFFKGKYLLYICLLVCLVIICLSLISKILDVLSVTNGWHYTVDGINGERKFYEGTIIVIPIILVTTMIKLFQRWVSDRNSFAELRNITLKMELSELRNQINPHFLFNMLNGIKSLIRTDPEKAGTVIIKLSELLRFQLYENDEQKIMLKQEINFLKNFLDLEKIRRDNFVTDIDCNVPPHILNNISIPPSLFTAFVENAVKHSVNVSGASSFVKVIFKIDGKRLYFTCINSKDADCIQPDGKNSGIGLVNITRRLKLLYADRYKLDLKGEKYEYTVSLNFEI